jgi:hypothetical protein
MDKIIKITLGLLLVIIIAFTATFGYTSYVENAYTKSLTSNYSYYCTITTDSVLTNVTFFIPVPADPSGNSPVIAQISAKSVVGLPDGWQATLYDTGKSTYVKLTTPSIMPSAGTTAKSPPSVNISVDIPTLKLIDTTNPLDHSAVYRPVQNIKDVPCSAASGDLLPAQHCFEYLTTMYADYSAAPNASVSITSAVTGKNDWNIFKPGHNQYSNRIYVLMFGENHGWTITRASLEAGVGDNDAPVIPL